MLEFRWVILLTLWTMLIGPVFDAAPSTHKAQQRKVQVAQRER